MSAPIHRLKTLPPYFEGVASGRKPFGDAMGAIRDLAMKVGIVAPRKGGSDAP